MMVMVMIIIMNFGLGFTLSAGNSPLSVLTEVKKLLVTSAVDPPSKRCHGNSCSISEIILSCGQVGLLHSSYRFVCSTMCKERVPAVLTRRLFARATTCRSLPTVLM